MGKSTENGQAVVPTKIDGNLPAGNIGQFQQFLRSRLPTIKQVAAKHLTPERVFRMVVVNVSKTPALQKCTMESIFRCVVQSVELGLEPGSALGEGYLVPYGNQCTFIPGYRGLIALAYRSGQVKSVSSFCVYQGDRFEFELGLNPKIVHVPSVTETPKPEALTFAYTVIQLKDGGMVYDVMSRGQIDAIRARSKAGHSGPWVTDYPEMARKTVTRRCLKYAPMSVEMSKALAADEAVDTGDTGAIEAEFESLDFQEEEAVSKTEALKGKIPGAPDPETGEVPIDTNDPSARPTDAPQETLV